MLLPIQQHTTKYNYPSPVAYRNVNMYGNIYKNPEQLEKTLISKILEIKKDPDGNTIIVALAMYALAYLSGQGSKFKDTDVYGDMLSRISTYISTLKKNNPCTDTTQEEAIQDNNKPVIERAMTQLPYDELAKRYARLLERKPNRTKYIDFLANYNKLCEKYKYLLEQRILRSRDQKVRDMLSGFEGFMFRLDGLTNGYNKALPEEKDQKVNPLEFLQSLETTYINYFEDICLMLNKEKELKKLNKIGQGSDIRMFDDIARQTLSIEDIKEYLKYPNISYKEFLFAKEYKLEGSLQKFNDIKEIYDLTEYRLIKGKEEGVPRIALQFNSVLSTTDFLRANAEFFKSIYGNNTLCSNEIYIQETYTKSNLSKELFSRVNKDPTPTEMYNFIRFINPEALEKYNYTNEELDNIKRPSADTLKRINNGNASKEEIENYEKFKKLNQLFCREIAYLDDNDKFKEILDVINDKSIFKYNYMRNLHSKLRFICRFVINEELEPGIKLKDKCKRKVEYLESALKEAMKKSVLVYKYTERSSNGVAPCFYLLENNNLGKNVLIAINGDGDIRTMYEKKDKNNENK